MSLAQGVVIGVFERKSRLEIWGGYDPHDLEGIIKREAVRLIQFRSQARSVTKKG